MKYIEAIFRIAGNNGQEISDGQLLQTAKDILCCKAGEAGFESFEDLPDGVAGYVQRDMFDKAALDDSIAVFPVSGVSVSYTFGDAEDKDWNETWEETGFEPIVVKGKCVIHDTLHSVPGGCGGCIDITIDARQAFGTGTHDTTFMIVGELLDMDLRGKYVLDCGCGTGILSVVAARMGAAGVSGYDIDERSVANTRHNCEINSVANVEVAHGDAGVIRSFGRKFDVILANINRNILLADMPEFVKVMSAGGTLILSGFYCDDAGMLTDKACSLGVQLVGKSERNGWCMLKFACS